MFKIGDFARINQVTIRTLRYYDEVGLLKPHEIDRWTGYRYYTMDQVPVLNRIMTYKDLGLSLEQIRQLVGDELPAEQVRGMLRLKQAELKGEAAEIQERLARIEARLAQLEMEGKVANYDVTLKKVDAVRVALVRGTVTNEESITPTFNRLFDDAIKYVSSNGGDFAGPAIALWYGLPEDEIQNVPVGAAMPTNGKLPNVGQAHIEELPEVETMACTTHNGSFSTISQAYGALVTWINENGYKTYDATREVYLVYKRNGDPGMYVTEVQFPVKRA